MTDDTSDIGPTGDFPRGKLNDMDEGGLQLAIGAENGVVVLNFGKPVAWIGLPPQQAADLATQLVKWARVAANESGETVTFTIGGP